MTGAQTYFNPRKDGVQKFYVDNNLVKEYKRISGQCFSHVDDEERRRVWGLFGDADTTVDTFDLFREHYPTAIHYHGEHRVDERSYMHAVMPVIRWIDDRQEGRLRPVVLIAEESVVDKWGKPLGSSQKAFRQLIERYDVHFVAPADFNDSERMKEVTAWMLEYFDAPAYNHVIFSNQKHLLAADYLIDTAPHDNFMGTVVELGSDAFKNWEDIITYFDRLGGQ